MKLVDVIKLSSYQMVDLLGLLCNFVTEKNKFKKPMKIAAKSILLIILLKLHNKDSYKVSRGYLRKVLNLSNNTINVAYQDLIDYGIIKLNPDSSISINYDSVVMKSCIKSLITKEEEVVEGITSDEYIKNLGDL